MIVISCRAIEDKQLNNNFYRATKFYGSNTDVQLKILRNCAHYLSQQKSVSPLKIKLHEALADFHESNVNKKML